MGPDSLKSAISWASNETCGAGIFAMLFLALLVIDTSNICCKYSKKIERNDRINLELLHLKTCRFGLARVGGG
jgi:hypothetical protein